MPQMLELWLPILASAACVFVSSAIIWMATPLHKNDYKSPGDKEDRVLEFAKSISLAPGVYCFPWMKCEKNADQAAVKAKMDAGPWWSLTVMHAKPNFGASLILWFLNSLVVSAIVGYVTYHTLASSAHYLKVFQIAGATATLAYCGYLLPMVSWHALPLKQLPAKIFDGLVYSLLTAGCFGWLWPHAVHAIPAA